MNDNYIVVNFTCRLCGRRVPVRVKKDDLEKFENNECSIQDAFPYLTPDKREMFLSRICGECFDRIFKEDE